MRTRVYIDGFNLYYGALKGTPFRWLDPVKLCTSLLPSHCVVDKVRYFTAHVSGVVDRRAPARQQVYLNALQTLPQVEVHFGSFLTKTLWRPLVNLPVAGESIATPTPVVLPAGDHTVSGSSARTLPVRAYGRRSKASARLSNAVIAEFHTIEEKGSDVNLASHLLNDAWSGLFDAAAVISNDTDLVTPVQIVAVEQGKTVFMVSPSGRVASKLSRAASHVRHLRTKMLKGAQFPATIPGTTISKPTGW